MSETPPRAPKADQRSERRTPYRLPLTLLRKREQIPLRSEDVSARGLFIETDDPPPMRQLVRLALLLPPFHRELVAHGMVAHVVPPGNAEGRPPGVGVVLYALDRAARIAWETFVARVEAGEFQRGASDAEAVAEIGFLDPELAEG